MLNGLFELIANTLNFFYIVPNYAVAIAADLCRDDHHHAAHAQGHAR